MSAKVTCRECGSILPAQVDLKGQCPVCLLQGSLEPSEAGEDSPVEKEPGSAEKEPPLPAAEIRTLQRRFPQLEILEVLGRGGMGVVYKARQKRLDRTVALKVLSSRVASESAFADRFQREARALARLQHPHIVLVYDFGEVEGQYYLVMEYVHGASLRQVLRDGGLTPLQALSVVPQICEGLQYAHEQGVVHRDIKPENILLDDRGMVKIADFGLAKLLDRGTDDHTLTGASQVMGTLHYMAPEQIRNPLQVDHRVDIYSLGVVFYELLTGELPMGQFPPPSDRAAVDARVDQVVLKALAREPERRYQQVSEVRTEVESVQPRSEPAGAKASGAEPKPAREAGTDGDATESESLASLIAKIPGGVPVAAGAALVLGWAALFLFAFLGGSNEEWLAGAYPFFFYPLVVLNPRMGGRGFFVSQLLRLAGVASGVAMFVSLCLGSSSVQKMMLESLAGVVYVVAHVFFDRWARRGAWDHFGKFVVLMILATVMHSSMMNYPGRAAYYFSSGMIAVMGATSGLILLAWPERGRGDFAPILKAGLCGVIGAALYFHRYVF